MTVAFQLVLIESLRMPREGTEQRKLTAIMFTDMVGYGALARCNGALVLASPKENRQFSQLGFHRSQGDVINITHGLTQS